jgi:hypothetical protein
MRSVVLGDHRPPKCIRDCAKVGRDGGEGGGGEGGGATSVRATLPTASTVLPSAALRADTDVVVSVVAAATAAAGVGYCMVAVTATEAAVTASMIADGDTPIWIARASRNVAWLKLDTSPATAKVAVMAAAKGASC